MKIVFTLCLLICAQYVVAQSVDRPKEGFLVSLSQSRVEIKAGESAQLKFTLVKAKTLLKSNVTFTSSQLPDGIQIVFSPDSGKVEEAEVALTALSGAQPGEYTIILNAEVNHQKKGVMLKLVIQ